MYTVVRTVQIHRNVQSIPKLALPLLKRIFVVVVVVVVLQLLVEELLSQLSLLESNHHPFYRVQSFIDRNAYNEWVIHEKGEIQALIKGFWHFPQPPIPALPLNMSEMHTEYHELMLRLIRWVPAVLGQNKIYVCFLLQPFQN